MTKPVNERRKTQRIDIKLAVGVVVKELGDRFFVGSIVNIGAGGIGLIINTFLPQGTKIMVNFELQEGKKLENVAGQVIRSFEAEDKFFSAVSFHNLPAEQAREISVYTGSVTFLKTIKPFATLTDEEAWYIRKISKEVYYKDLQSIFDEGSEGNALYIVINGKVNIVKKNLQGKPEVLATLKEGEFFGEIALLDEGPRSASAVSLEHASLFMITREDFKKTLGNNDALSIKLLWVFINTLTQRLRAVDMVMAEMLFSSRHDKV